MEIKDFISQIKMLGFKNTNDPSIFKMGSIEVDISDEFTKTPYDPNTKYPDGMFISDDNMEKLITFIEVNT